VAECGADESLIAYYAEAIRQEINKAEASRLVNQILEHSTSLSYDVVMKTWQEIADIFAAELHSVK
jgi:hypothetical protein